MTPDQATKTRGRSSRVGTSSFGRLGRLGLAVLKQLQFHETDSLSNIQRNARGSHQRFIQCTRGGHHGPRGLTSSGQGSIVESGSNGSIPNPTWLMVSADGLLDEWTCSQEWHLSEHGTETRVHWIALFHALWKDIGLRGGGRRWIRETCSAW